MHHEGVWPGLVLGLFEPTYRESVMRIRWNSVAEYVESGLLVATVVDGDKEPTGDSATVDLTKFYSLWKKMPLSERYAAGNGVKQICGDSATKGNASEKVVRITTTFEELLAGAMPGTGSKTTLIVKALARRFGKDEPEMLKIWDGWSDGKKNQALADSVNKGLVNEIKSERLEVERAAMAEAAVGTEEPEFTL